MATAEAIIASQQGYAESVVDLASDAISDMRADIANVGFTAISFSGVTLPDAPELPEPVAEPTLAPVNLELTAEPSTTIEFQNISPIEVGVVPTLTATAPTVNLPNLPTQLADFTEAPPIIQTNYTFPDVPDELDNPLIAAPELGTYTMPTAPTIALPAFEGVAPTADLTPPSDLQAQLISAYNNASPQFVSALNGQMDAWLSTYNPRYHQQLAAIEDKLASYLDGGTGLNPVIEEAIYERSRSRQRAEARRAADAAWEETAGRGFTNPGGAVLAGIRRSRQAAADNNATAAREIVVMQAEMEQKNLQFAVTTSAGLRQAMLGAALSYHGNLVQINGQAIDYARSVVANIVEVYNLNVRAFEARLSAYRSEAAVYDTRLKAAMSYVELYRAEIDAVQALVQVDQGKVALYRGRIDALQSLATVYKARVDAIVEQASLEKLKLDLFKTKVEARLAQVQEKRAQYDAYGAAIQGEESKVRIYTAQVGAFAQQISGYKATIDAQSEVVRAQALTNQARTEQVRAVTDIYRTISQVRGDKARTELQLQQQQLNVYDVKNRATIATAELGATIYRTVANVVQENAKLEVDTLIKNADLNLGRTKAVGDLGVASAQVYQGMASAALSGMNSLVAQTLAE